MKKLNFFLILFIHSICYSQSTNSLPQDSIYSKHVEITQTKKYCDVLDVTPFLWTHGCTPTAMGMLIDYYDRHGMDFLMDNFNDIVNNDHYIKYSIPKDNADHLLPDSSITNPTKNCLADFLNTSWYIYGNYYGATIMFDQGPGIIKYVEFKNKDCVVDLDFIHGWEDFKSIIDEKRPILLAVNVDSNNTIFHSIIAIGYSDSLYAAYNTWDKKIHWYKYIVRTGTTIDNRIPWTVVWMADIILNCNNTSIKNITIENFNENQNYYDILGRKVIPLKSGIYINKNSKYYIDVSIYRGY